jgi:hypothetical protein
MNINNLSLSWNCEVKSQLFSKNIRVFVVPSEGFHNKNKEVSLLFPKTSQGFKNNLDRIFTAKFLFYPIALHKEREPALRGVREKQN